MMTMMMKKHGCHQCNVTHQWAFEAFYHFVFFQLGVELREKPLMMTCESQNSHTLTHTLLHLPCWSNSWKPKYGVNII